MGRVWTFADSFATGNALKEGIPVAIVGAPTVEKSTLLNALLGDDRAIVSDIPGTTRDTVEDACTIQGMRFRFIDTAGLRDTQDVVEAEGIRRVGQGCDSLHRPSHARCLHRHPQRCCRPTE